MDVRRREEDKQEVAVVGHKSPLSTYTFAVDKIYSLHLTDANYSDSIG